MFVVLYFSQIHATLWTNIYHNMLYCVHISVVYVPNIHFYGDFCDFAMISLVISVISVISVIRRTSRNAT